MFRRPKHNREHFPRRPGRRTQSPLQPWLLLLLLQKPSYGYELMERLGGKEIPDTDPGLLYRSLRQLEGEGMVHSSWDTEREGPARRLYQVTPEGTEHLHTRADSIRRMQDQLGRFLTEYEAYFKTEGRK
jgi:PadR family transcriptional regulator PadR